MFPSRRPWSCLASAARLAVAPGLLWIALLAPVESRAQENPFSINGSPARHASDSSAGVDLVDPLSGNLLLAHTDLELPGNAGFDLRVVRYYNSNIYRHYAQGSTAIEEPSWVGLGWRLHFGRVIHPDSTVVGETQIEMPDGSRHPVYQVDDTGWWRSADFFLYSPSAHQLKLPNGLVYTFGHVSAAVDGGELGAMRYVTQISDPFNNTLVFTYFSAAEGHTGGVKQILQDLGDGQVRQVDFTLIPGGRLLASMTYNSRTWSYDYAEHATGSLVLAYANFPRLSPHFRRWAYGYGTTVGEEELTQVTSPTWASEYGYDIVARTADSTSYNARVVSSRRTGGDETTALGVWCYYYNRGTNLNETHVSGPNSFTVYVYNGIGTTGPFNAWRTGTLAARMTFPPEGVGPTGLESETFTYERSDALVNVAVGTGPWSDNAVYRPLLTQRTITRDTNTAYQASWTTYYAYHSGDGTYNDYGQPWRIWQSPALLTARDTQRVFKAPSFFTPYLVGRVESMTTQYSDGAGHFLATTVNGQSASYTYDAATGFVTSAMVDGVATSMLPTSRGNVASMTKGPLTTALQYAWGAVSRIESPLSRTERTIPGPDPSPTSETVGKSPDTPLTTRYDYDTIGRLERLTPAGSTGSGDTPARTVYTYDDASAWPMWAQASRGYSSQTVVRTFADHRGQVLRTETSGGSTPTLKTRITRDGGSREIFRSAPFTTDDPTAGTWFTHDALDRVTTVVRAAIDPAVNPRSTTTYRPAPGTPRSTTTYTYRGPDTIVTDPNGKQTTYHSAFFSGPGDGRLVSVTDAKNQVTTYQYRLTDTLTRAEGPGCAPGDGSCTIGAGPIRTWTYNTTTNRLSSEQQPESGLVEYTAYDTVGNVTDYRKRLTSSTYEATHIVYDALSRPTSRTTVGSGSSVGWDYDTLGRTATVTSDVTTTYTPDPSTGRPWKRKDERLGANGWIYTTTYGFDDRDRLKQITYPNPGARTVGYTYDDQGRLLTVTNNTSTFASNFLYDTAGRLYQYVTGAVTHTVGYTVQDQVSSVTTSGLQGTNLNVTYNHDPAGNVESLTDGGVSETFKHDDLHRLTKAEGPWGTLEWDYDPTGNRLSERAGGLVTTYQYDPITNRLSSTAGASPETFAYDAFGRLIQDSQASYTYRPDGAPLSATRTGMSASYVSDGDGLRVERTVNGQRSVSVRGLGGQVLSEFEAEGCAGSSLVWRRDLVYAGGRLIGSVKNATVRPSVAFAAATGSAAENAASASIVVQLTTAAALGCPVSVSYQTHNGTATAGQDYTTATGMVTFPAGSVNGATQTISVPLTDDLIYEGNETVAVTLATPIGADLGAISSHTLTITENEPVPTLSINDATVAEGATASATFTVTLSRACSFPVSVSYVTANGTATAGDDYTATSGTLAIPALAITGTLTVPILNDALVEATETFTVTLSGQTAPLTLARATGTGSITDTQLLIDRVRRDSVVWNPTTGVWQVRWHAENYQTVHSYTFGGAAGDVPVPGAWDGDNLVDLAIYRPSSGTWYILKSQGGYTQWTYYGWGAATDVPVPADYDGDGKLDPAVWRPSTGVWYILKSGDNYNPATALTITFGLPNDMPFPGEHGTDGRADLAFYRPIDGTWHALTSDSGYSAAAELTWQWGLPVATCVPSTGISVQLEGNPSLEAMWQSTTATVAAGQTVSVTAPGSWTGNNVTYTANGGSTTPVDPPPGANSPLYTAPLMSLVGRIGTTGTPFLVGAHKIFTAPATGTLYLAPNRNWYDLSNNEGSLNVTVCASQWTDACDRPVPADFDGDRRVDPSVYRPTSGTWFTLKSHPNYTLWSSTGWGISTDTPIPADYDGDGKADVSVWRGSTGVWYVLGSAGGSASWTTPTSGDGFQAVRVR